MPVITEEKRLENRKKLLRCTYHLFNCLGEKMTTQMVCTEANVGKGTLFLYFATKDILLHEAYTEANENASRLTWRNLILTGDKRDIVRQLIVNAVEWPLRYPEEVIFCNRYYNSMANQDALDDNPAEKYMTAFDAPGVMECLLKDTVSETIRRYARHAASTLLFSFMIFIAGHPKEAENQELLEYVVDRVTGFFIE